MIWVNGLVVPDDVLKVSVLDRTFEHGLGLFETLRTWNGRAPLLVDHLKRMARSAVDLGLPCPDYFPDDESVAELLRAEQVVGDVVLRITLSGGLGETTGAMLWMRTAPLPPAMNRPGAVVDLGPWRVFGGDALTRHKSLNYWSRRRAYETSRKLGFDEVLSMTDDGCIWEGSRTNLFVVSGSRLFTPSALGPIVPGVMRALVIESAANLPLAVEKTASLTRKMLVTADEVFLTNSVRGIVPVERFEYVSWSAPGDWTRRLQILVADKLGSAGIEGGDAR